MSLIARLPLLIASPLLLLSACETIEGPGTPQPFAMPDLVVPMKLKIDGMDASHALADAGRLRNAVRKMGTNTNPPNLQALINQVRNDDAGKGGKGLTSLAGPFGHSFLNAAEDHLNAVGNFDPQVTVTEDFSGKITGYEYTPSPTDNRRGSLDLHVQTYITRTVVRPTGPSFKTESYKWEISVDPNHAEIIENSGNPQDPFPNTIAFGQATLDRIQQEGFHWKLWAKGSHIKIDRVEYNPDYDPADPEAGFSWIDPNAPQWRRFWNLYKTTPESCIDMMFKNRTDLPLPFPTEYSELLEPPFYCLGRCENPMIINTR